MDYIIKAYGKKNYSNLMKKEIINKKGKKQNVWIAKYGHLKLHRYPPPEVKDVKVNLKGNLNDHSVLSWKHPDTGYDVHAYTQERMKQQSQKKWARENSFKDDILNNVKTKTETLVKKNKSEAVKQASTVLSIIAQTGLRIGDRFYTKATGNRGVLTLKPENVKIKDGKAFFNFTGKSYVENSAEFDNPTVVKYLSELKQKNSDKEFLFDVGKADITKVWRDALGMGNKFLIKEMRTKVASNLAREI